MQTDKQTTLLIYFLPYEFVSENLRVTVGDAPIDVCSRLKKEPSGYFAVQFSSFFSSWIWTFCMARPNKVSL